MRVWTNGRDLFAEMCLRKTGVAMLHAFDIRQDGMCAAKKPGNLKKSNKWKSDCAATDTPAMHPFKNLMNIQLAWRQQQEWSTSDKEVVELNFVWWDD